MAFVNPYFVIISKIFFSVTLGPCMAQTSYYAALHMA
jgi:hypothetical protein